MAKRMPKRCVHLTKVPKDTSTYCLDGSMYICSLTSQPCIARIEGEVSVQPSHYSPETTYSYDPAFAQKRCPAYTIQPQTVKGQVLAIDGERIIDVVARLSDEEVATFLREHDLEYLVTNERIDALLAKALGKPVKAPLRLIVVWDRDKQKPKTED